LSIFIFPTPLPVIGSGENSFPPDSQILRRTIKKRSGNFPKLSAETGTHEIAVRIKKKEKGSHKENYKVMVPSNI